MAEERVREGDAPRPLGVVVTRDEDENGPLTQALKGRGARVLHWGSIAFVPPEDPEPFFSALNRLEEFDWICFSSPRAVAAVLDRVPDPPEGLKVAVVGPSTGDAVREGGWPVHRLPEEGSGEGVVDAFQVAGDAGGARIFFPASAVARPTIPQGLGRLGAQVHQVVAYRLVNLPLDREECRRALVGGEVGAVTFASPSAMRGLEEGLGPELFGRMAEDVPAAAMGSTTAGALTEAGWKRIVVAAEPSLDALAEAAVTAAAQEDGVDVPDSD